MAGGDSRGGRAPSGVPAGAEDEGDDTLVALIGMAGRFPGAPDLDTFWNNLAAGVESTRRFTYEELLSAGESPAALSDPRYVPVCPVLDDIDKFDAGFFGFSPKDAAIADPQHRLFLEIAWEALENAGYDPDDAGVVGVWAACGLNSYLMHHLVTNPEVMETVGEWLVRHTANDMNFLATRVSYELGLTGPSMNVQTACSSALVAVHLAAQSLLGRECDVALAGGSTLALPQRGYVHREGEILSADGHCRPFDARSTGTLFGSGAGAVVLKRLADARRDGDHVLAVVRGSAINNDGSQKVGYLAPSVEGQARAVSEALSVSGIDASTIGYVEAHGTGTLIGDPIEVMGLTQAFRAHTERRSFCGLGSLKSNIGHLGEAAGVSSVIKTVLALQHHQIPPSVGYESPNPNIDLPNSPFYVPQTLVEWPGGATPRRAGVTALGAGGTNAHVILEEAPPAPPGGPSRDWHILPLSARSAPALEAATKRLAAHLRAHPTLPLADVAYTLQVGRRAFAHRRIAVCRDTAHAIAVLEGREPRRLHAQTTTRRPPEIVFSFPGGGAQQHWAWDRSSTSPSRPSAPPSTSASSVVRPELGVDLRSLLYPDPAARDAVQARLGRPSLALPALFATEYALTRLLAAWGITPAAMIGHSMGEYLAACLAGVFAPGDAMHLVAKRGLLSETLPPGGMLVVPLAPDELARVAPDNGLSIAAVNAPELCVASGALEAIIALESRLRARDLDVRRLHVDMPAHSTMLDPILPEFERFVRTITLSAPRLPYISNLTGAWITAREACDPAYWVRHLRHTVRFADGLQTLVGGRPDRVLLEIGPGRSLTSLAMMQPTKPAAALPTMAHPKEEQSSAAFFMTTLGQLWLAGAKLDWKRGHGEAARRRRVPLPTYPFERQRFWIDRVARATTPAPAPGALKRKPDVADWFWLPSWSRTASLPATAPEGTTLLFAGSDAGHEAGGGELGQALAARLPGAVSVRAGAGFTRVSEQGVHRRAGPPRRLRAALRDPARRGQPARRDRPPLGRVGENRPRRPRRRRPGPLRPRGRARPREPARARPGPRARGSARAAHDRVERPAPHRRRARARAAHGAPAGAGAGHRRRAARHREPQRRRVVARAGAVAASAHRRPGAERARRATRGGPDARGEGDRLPRRRADRAIILARPVALRGRARLPRGRRLPDHGRARGHRRDAGRAPGADRAREARAREPDGAPRPGAGGARRGDAGPAGRRHRHRSDARRDDHGPRALRDAHGNHSRGGRARG